MGAEADIEAFLIYTRLADILEAHVRSNRKGWARYLTMPFFATTNAVLSKKGERPIPNQLGNFDELIQSCIQQFGLPEPEEGAANVPE